MRYTAILSTVFKHLGSDGRVHSGFSWSYGTELSWELCMAGVGVGLVDMAVA